MNKVEVRVLSEYGDPLQHMGFLARLTQRGNKISNMEELVNLLESDPPGPKTMDEMVKLPHGTIKRFTPITIAIVGASRRFLAQARTHQVGMHYVSASLQYSDYSDGYDFFVPYEIYENKVVPAYIQSCKKSMQTYKALAQLVGNDAAGYAAPQGLRNVLIMQGNHQSWDYFIRTRGCNRNTTETQYVTMLIWEALLNSQDGEAMFKYAGADCVHGSCREGKFCCGRPIIYNNPRKIIEDRWPLLGGEWI